LFKGRTYGSLDYYNNNTFDLLYSVAIPDVTGFQNITTNLGKINNKGFEATVTHNILGGKGINWAATAVFSRNINRIITLTGQDANKDGIEDDLIASNLFIGKSISTIYHYQTNGVYGLTDARLPGFPIGTMRVVDQNGDGDITAALDRVFIGREEPAYRMSLMNTFSFKGFALNVLLNSVQGGKDSYLGVNRPFANNIPQYYREDNSVRWNDFVGIDYWSPNNPNGKYPRNISGSRAKIEPNMYEDRSFIRLQDVSLSYNLASSVLKKVNAQSINLFVSGKNLATWTKWQGWDPETGEGIVAGGRPVMKAFTVGLNITY
jgi:TonB-dependent starch-binding outer membrane protein SusC